MRACVAAGIMVMLIAASSASATELTIVPGVGIGKLKLGMTLAQAEHALGKDHLLNGRGTVGDKHFVEYAWDFASWSAVFVQSGKTLRLAQVMTSKYTQRTATGLGVDSRFKAMVRAYPDARCGSYYFTLGSKQTTGTGPSERGLGHALVVKRNGAELAFFVKPVNGTPNSYPAGYTGPWEVWQVLMRAPVPGEVDPPYHCSSGWRERGSPFTP
jgi:hypothetical protein